MLKPQGHSLANNADTNDATKRILMEMVVRDLGVWPAIKQLSELQMKRLRGERHENVSYYFMNLMRMLDSIGLADCASYEIDMASARLDEEKRKKDDEQ